MKRAGHEAAADTPQPPVVTRGILSEILKGKNATVAAKASAHFEHICAAKYDLFIDNWRLP